MKNEERKPSPNSPDFGFEAGCEAALKLRSKKLRSKKNYINNFGQHAFLSRHGG